MIKAITLLALTLLLASCAGIPFCDEKGKPVGCKKWDPATRAGAGVRS